MLKKNRKIVYLVLIVLMALALIGVIYLTFFYFPECQNYDCWQKYMSRCSKASFVNDEAGASWGYEVMGDEGGQCVIEVNLLLAKTGELGIADLVGESMTCSYPLGSAAYAEKNLEKCHGQLKEDLQTIMITKLHTYIIENLEKVGEGLNGAA